MPVRKDRTPSLRGTYEATRGLIGGALSGTDETFLPTGAVCEGFGDEIGDTGGFGEEETGYGSPCANESWHIASILEESLSFSYISEISPAEFSTGIVREDGGELVVLGAVGPLQPGPYKIYIRPEGTLNRIPAYSGVLGQGNDIYPDNERNRLIFVAPMTSQLGAADIILERPGSQIVVAGLLTYVAFTQRSGTRFLQTLFPPNWDVGRYDPTVES